MKKVRAIFFDFDGTVCDSFGEIISIFNEISSQFAFKKISPEQERAFRDTSSEEFFGSIGVAQDKLPEVLKAVNVELGKRVERMRFFPDLERVLKELGGRGYRLGILTSNVEENVRKFLNRNGFSGFERICSGSSLFGKHETILDLMQELRLTPEELIYVGDETRDIDASKRAGVASVAVTWGFHSRKVLSARGPAHVIDRPAELLDLF